MFCYFLPVALLRHQLSPSLGHSQQQTLRFLPSSNKTTKKALSRFCFPFQQSSYFSKSLFRPTISSLFPPVPKILAFISTKTTLLTLPSQLLVGESNGLGSVLILLKLSLVFSSFVETFFSHDFQDKYNLPGVISVCNFPVGFTGVS